MREKIELISFASDNNSGVHPTIFEAIGKSNQGHYVGYGEDPFTKRAEQAFQEIFGTQSRTFFALTGTGANVIGLQLIVQPWQSIFCSDNSHINVDECGAPERFAQTKLVAEPNRSGKIMPEQFGHHLVHRGFEHHVQPGAISLTQATELGSVYTLDELTKWKNFARKESLLIHMDGARFANALDFLKCSPAELVEAGGVDVLSFGGTKNGMMMGEALVVLNPLLQDRVPYVRKQSAQLLSKMRYVGAQFEAYLKEDLWLRLASHSNEMAKKLEDGLRELGFEIPYSVETNAVFANFPQELTQSMWDAGYYFYVWDEQKSVIRLMTSFDTNPQDIDSFLQKVRDLSGN